MDPIALLGGACLAAALAGSVAGWRLWTGEDRRLCRERARPEPPRRPLAPLAGGFGTRTLADDEHEGRSSWDEKREREGEHGRIGSDPAP